MASILQITNEKPRTFQPSLTRNPLIKKLDEAIDDMEQGKIQTIDEAWEEIDTI